MVRQEQKNCRAFIEGNVEEELCMCIETIMDELIDNATAVKRLRNVTHSILMH